MNDRDRIAARIRALLAKTVENGCTEDEAVAAAAKAAEMLAKYNLTVDEVQLRESPFQRHTEHHDDFVGDRLWKVADAIAHLTGSRYWTSPIGVRPVEINFFGFAHEVDVSKYLLAICARAMNDNLERLHRDYGLLTFAAKRRKFIPFMDGMADSLARRIRALRPPEPTGTGLIVLRGQLIDAAMPVKIKQRDMRSSRDFESDYLNGLIAGDRVALNSALQGGPTTDRKRLNSR
jgi:Protein of unknown function (DUF2786).